MDVVCGNCQSKFVIPDHKIPKGQTVSIPCPKCKHKIKVALPDESPPQKARSSAQVQEAPAQTNNGEEGIRSDSPFDFLEEGVQTALVCESDATARSKICAFLESMEYKISAPQSPRDAMKQMRAHDFDMIVVNELFGTRDPDMNHVLRFVNQQIMLVRRKIFVVLLTERYTTMDTMWAYNKSVNVLVNIKDVGQIDKVLKRSLNEYNLFYKTFMELLQKTGKA